MPIYIDAHGNRQPDRRQQRHLRDLFDGFRAIVEPFIRAGGSWGQSELSYLARRQIQESYPHLSSQDIHVLTQAVVRVLRDEAAPAGTG
jgi:hypothetical protein